MTENTVVLPMEAIEAAKSIAMWAALALAGMGTLFGVIIRWMMSRIDRSHATLEAAVASFEKATDKLAEAVSELKDEIKSRHAQDAA
jgi:ABC-type branched-subunit amino acid transport system permease subunit